jgi:aminoglycoside phosphotransferase (APT) family kinase protein
MNSPQQNPTLAVDDDERLRQALTAHLRAETGQSWMLSTFTRYAVGFSWITYGFSARAENTADERGLILRLGPPYGLYAPYSARPQHAALKALENSRVPVPRVFWWSDDASILGAPFFVSEKMPGVVPVPWSGDFEDGRRQRIGEQFVAALAALHATDVRGSGMDDATTTVTNAAQRQIDHWQAAGERWAHKPYPMLHSALRWLRRHQPVAPCVSLIHGDYRLGNFLEEDGRITAILDWELVHVGDPHEDIGWAFLPQFAMGSSLICRLISREAFIAQYERESGIVLNPASIHFYTVFALVKLALTHIAAAHCFEAGSYNDLRMPAMGTQVAPVLRQIEKLLNE